MKTKTKSLPLTDVHYSDLHYLELQHINVKVLLKDTQGLDLDPVVAVFHSWIQDQVCDELLLDVADYRHVHGGPGVILIGHQADYSIDNTDDRLGVRYNRKDVVEGSNSERLRQSVLAALSACSRLQEDTRLDGKFHFNGQDIEITINDRLLAPNSEATRQTLNADFQAFSSMLFAGGEYSLSANPDPRRLLSVSLRASRPFTVKELLENLQFNQSHALQNDALESAAPQNEALRKVGPTHANPDYNWDEGQRIRAAH